MTDIKITSFEGSEFVARCCLPKTKAGPGLILIPDRAFSEEIVGVLADRYAADGYMTVCPDLFWRERACETANISNMDVEATLRDLISVLGYVRAMKGCNGKVGAVGYGLGGRLAFLMAARSDVDATVCYDPSDLNKNIDETPDIRMPVLAHFADKPALVSEDTRHRIMLRLARNPVLATFVYDGTDNAIFRDDAHANNAQAAALAAQRSKEFLEKCLMN